MIGRPIRRLIAAIAAALFVTPAAHATSGAALTPPAPTVTSIFFGMHVNHVTTDWPAVPFGSLAKPNCAQWPSIQPHSTDPYNWSVLDGYATAAASHGTTFTYAPGTLAIPQWATSNPATCSANACGTGAGQCGAPPTNESLLTGFFSALAARYCTKMSYELWNEPWDTNGPTAAQLVTMTQDEETAIRAACPNAVIISPSFSGDNSTGHITYMQTYYADGGPTDVDAASLHIYATGGPNNGVDLPESIDPATGHGIDYGAVASTIAQYLPNKPIWMTEGSWNCPTCAQDFPTASTEAGFIARWFLIQWKMKFQVSDWYEYDNAGFGTLDPAVRSDGSTVPEVAFQQIYNWMVGRQMTAPCSTATPTITVSTYTCGLSGAGGYKALAAWITGGSTSFTPPSPSTYSQYRDLAGVVHAYSGGSVTITTNPILFEN